MRELEISEEGLEYFRVRLKEEYEVEHVEDVFGIPIYPNYMCDQIDRIRDMFGRASGYVREFESLHSVSDGYSDDAYGEFSDVTSDLYGKVIDEFDWYDSDIGELVYGVTRLEDWVSGLIDLAKLLGLSEAGEFSHRLNYELDRLDAECNEVMDSRRRFSTDMSRMEWLAVYTLDDGSVLEDLRSEVERVRAFGVELRSDVLREVYGMVEDFGYGIVSELRI